MIDMILIGIIGIIIKLKTSIMCKKILKKNLDQLINDNQFKYHFMKLNKIIKFSRTQNQVFYFISSSLPTQNHHDCLSHALVFIRQDTYLWNIDYHYESLLAVQDFFFSFAYYYSRFVRDFWTRIKSISFWLIKKSCLFYDQFYSTFFVSILVVQSSCL